MLVIYILTHHIVILILNIGIQILQEIFGIIWLKFFVPVKFQNFKTANSKFNKLANLQQFYINLFWPIFRKNNVRFSLKVGCKIDKSMNIEHYQKF